MQCKDWLKIPCYACSVEWIHVHVFVRVLFMSAHAHINACECTVSRCLQRGRGLKIRFVSVLRMHLWNSCCCVGPERFRNQEPDRGGKINTVKLWSVCGGVHVSESVKQAEWGLWNGLSLIGLWRGCLFTLCVHSIRGQRRRTDRRVDGGLHIYLF